MAKSLGDMVSSCGGPTQGHILLEPLEHLCSAGETVVRDEATKSTKIVIGMITAEAVCADVMLFLRAPEFVIPNVCTPTQVPPSPSFFPSSLYAGKNCGTADVDQTLLWNDCKRAARMVHPQGMCVL